MNQQSAFSSTRRGFPGTAAFSLVELLIVVALMLVMYTLLLSPASKPAQRRRQEACRSNLQFIFMVGQMYANDQGGKWPAARAVTSSDQALTLLVPRHTTRTELFTCPGGRQPPLPPGQPFPGRRISYAYLMGLTQPALTPDQWLMSDAQVDMRPKDTNAPLFSAQKSGPGSNHRQFGGNVLFGDGHAGFSPAQARWPINAPSPTVILNPLP